MTDTCFVADMSSQNPVDFNKLRLATYKSKSVEAVILRATRSNCMTDPAFASRADEALKTGFLVGAYAFCTGEAAQTQVARFINATASFDTISRWLDFEPNPSGSQMSFDSMIDFLDGTDQKFGRATGLYSGSRLKQLIINATDQQREFLESHPLWGSEYGPKWKNLDVNGHPLPWESGPALWQYTDGQVGPQPHTFDGLEPHADLSVFQGTRDQLAALWGTKPAAPSASSASSSLMQVEQEILSLLDHTS